MTLEEIFNFIDTAYYTIPWYYALLVYLGITILIIIILVIVLHFLNKTIQ